MDQSREDRAMRRSRLRDVVVDCARPSLLAAFWAEVLGYEVAPYDDAEIARLRAAGIHDIADDPTVLILPPPRMRPHRASSSCRSPSRRQSRTACTL
jgi:hypothetical protein